MGSDFSGEGIFSLLNCGRGFCVYGGECLVV